jgi:hypothetical protein
VTSEELGEVLGDVLGWQGRMVAEGSRSGIMILRITQRAYLTSIEIILDLPSVCYNGLSSLCYTCSRR